MQKQQILRSSKNYTQRDFTLFLKSAPDLNPFWYSFFRRLDFPWKLEDVINISKHGALNC